VFPAYGLLPLLDVVPLYIPRLKLMWEDVINLCPVHCVIVIKVAIQVFLLPALITIPAFLQFDDTILIRLTNFEQNEGMWIRISLNGVFSSDVKAGQLMVN
jgi:hypothetical protein